MNSLNEDKIQKLERKISKLESDIDKAKERLFKIKPQKPMINEHTSYDSEKRELITFYEYWCPYCGEPLRKQKNKSVSRHKCGQMINWEWEEKDDFSGKS